MSEENRSLKYFDVSSSSRNRNEYPNMYDFIIPYTVNAGVTASYFFDPVLSSSPYSGSLFPLSTLVTGVSPDETHIKLDPNDTNVDNFYINSSLQIGSDFRTITNYNGITKIATTSEPFPVTPPINTHYQIRKSPTFFNSDVSIYHTDSNGLVDQLDLLTAAPSPIKDLYTNSYIRFTNGSHVGNTAIITSYTPFNTLSIWNQDSLPGSSSYIDTSTEIGFKFTPTKTGIFGSITLNLSSYDFVDNFRTIQLIIYQNDINGSSLYTENFQIPDSVLASDITLNLTSGPLLITGSSYAITLKDVSSTPTNGYISIFGIPSNLSYITYNTSTYPKVNITVYPLPGSSAWTQNDSLGVSTIVSTTQNQAFQFSPDTTGELSVISLNLVSFETVSIGRTLQIIIQDNTNTTIYQNNYILSNNTIPTDIEFAITGPTITSGSNYTILIKDITAGGTNTGYINIFGIFPTTTFISNTNVYPKLNVYLNDLLAWQQTINGGVSEYLSTSSEQGFRFVAQNTGTLSLISIFLTTFESVLGGRDLTINIRNGSGLGGTILYTNTYTIPTTSLLYYELNIPGGPSITSGNIYTLTVQDTTLGGSGFINVYGISPDSNYISYGINIYPRINFVVDTSGSGIAWSQSGSSTNSTFSSGENGYLFTPNISGRLTSIQAKISTYGTTITWRLRVRNGSGLSGDLLFTQDFIITTGLSTFIYNFIIDGPFIESGNNYTWSLEVITGSLSNARNIGIPTNSAYVSYNTSIYEMSTITVTNGLSIYTQQTNNTESDSVSQIEEYGFEFIPSGDIPRTMTSVSLSLTSNEYVLSGRSLTIKIREGSGLAGTLIFTGTQIVPNTSSKTLVDFIMGFPVLTPGTTYTISIQDTTGTNNGIIYIYGTDGYTRYNTNVYPELNININGNLLPTYIQPTNLTITDTISTTTEKGFEFTPNITGQLSTIALNLTSFEAVEVERSINVKIYDGAGLLGTVLYSKNFTINNLSTRTNFSLSINSTILSSGNTYTLSVIDITSGGTTTGNIFLYGITSNLTYTSYNTSVYPKINVNIGTNTYSYGQTSNPSVFDLISTTIEQGFVFFPEFSSTIAGVVLNISSYDSSGNRTLRVRVREGNGVSGTILTEQIQQLSNGRTNLEVKIDIPTFLQQHQSYTITIQDISIDITGNMIIYGIPSTSTFLSINTNVYPKLSTFGYTFILTINPPQSITGFLLSGPTLNNIEFNTEAHDNYTAMLHNGLPFTYSKYYQIGLQYLVLPNQLLKSGYGGTLANYPYVYVQIFNAGNRGGLNVISSNNPSSNFAIFKCPVDRYLYNIPTNFFTLRVDNKKQIIHFRPDQDIRIRITDPDGNILENNLDDDLSPLYPNGFLQINALFTFAPLNR